MASLKILMITDSLRCGGAEKSFSILARGLNQNGFDISCIILENKANAFFSLDNIPTYYLSEAPILGKWKKLLCLLYHAKLICYDIINKEYDIIISFQPRSNITIILAKFLPIRKLKSQFIISERDYLCYSKLSFQYVFKKFFYKKADFITCNGVEIKDLLCQHYKLDEKKIVIIPNGYDKKTILEKFNRKIEPKDKYIFENEKVKLITIGRLSIQKRQRFLLDVMAKLPDYFQLIIIGEGEYREKLQQYIMKLALEDRVFILGQRENPFPYLRLSDVFVFSSTHEGYPNAIAEALVCGKPVVSTYFKSGLKELLLDNGIGEVVPTNDIDKFVSILRSNIPTPKTNSILSHIELIYKYRALFEKLMNNEKR